MVRVPSFTAFFFGRLKRCIGTHVVVVVETGNGTSCVVVVVCRINYASLLVPKSSISFGMIITLVPVFIGYAPS